MKRFDMEKEVLNYESAMARIEEIVQLVEHRETGIDALADLLKEAQELMNYCREKLFTVESEIGKIMEKEESIANEQ